MPTSAPLVTVITVVRNAAQDIAATVESVRARKTSEVEYVVIDGQSTDGTLEILRRYADCIDVLVSEADRGIYDAMNKAMQRASGRFITHINAGDTLLRLPLTELAQACDADTVIAFPVRLGGGRVHTPRGGWRLSIINTIHHQGAYYRRSAARPYDLSYRTFSDFDLNQRLRRGLRVHANADAVAFHSEDGQSHDIRHFHEVYRIVEKNQGALHVALTWFYCKLRGLRRRLSFPSRSPS